MRLLLLARVSRGRPVSIARFKRRFCTKSKALTNFRSDLFLSLIFKVLFLF
jgi:hypothetical protein